MVDRVLPLPREGVRHHVTVITTHPIQYVAPWFRELARRTDMQLHVIYLRHLDQRAQGRGFGTNFAWDVPLLEGYASQSLQLGAKVPGFRSLLALWQALGRAPRGVLLVTGWNEPLLVVCQVFARLRGYKLLVRGESNALRRRSAIKRVLHRLLLKLPHAFLCIGSSNRYFYECSGVPVGRLFDGAYFVENDRLASMADEFSAQRPDLRRAMASSDAEIVLVFCGKHVPFKRPWLLIDAAKVLRERGWAVSVLFAGSGELTDDLRQRAVDANVPTHFTGFLNQTELWRAYVPADIFVLPSDTGETWGLVTNEAMLFGLPVAVSNEVGCSPDLVQEGTTGVRFHAEAGALADALEPLVADPALRKRMGAAGRDLVQTKFTSARATHGLIDAIRAMCA